MLIRLKRAIKIARTEGLTIALQKARRRITSRRRSGVYQKWISEFDTFSAGDNTTILENIDGFSHKPLISVLMPVYNVDEKWLRRAIDSVIAQSYGHWELCIADDCSTEPHVRAVLAGYAASDDRIRTVFREENGNISAASNSALELATGEFTALMDNDDELAPHAFYFVVQEINAHPAADLIYSDEDMIDERGRRFYHTFKPDWSPEFFYSINMLSHLSVFRNSLLGDAGGFRTGFEGSQDYDLALRVIERIPAENIRHIPRILYHWRSLPGSIAHSPDEKPEANDRARRAITEHFERTGVDGRSVKGIAGLHRAVYALPEQAPVVSVISIVDGDPSSFAERIISNTDHDLLELVIVVPESAGAMEIDRVKIIRFDGPRYQMLNDAARHATGSVLCFVDASTRPRSGDWLCEVVSQCMQPGVGAVGAKIVNQNGRIKHAGFILGVNGGVGRAHYGHHAQDPGYFVRLCSSQNFSAVSIDCLTIRRDIFDGAGGFDAGNFPDTYGDVDLCLRLLDTGLRNVWTPWAEVVQADRPDPTSEDELERLKERWAIFFQSDPYYNPNLTLENEDFALASRPRIAKLSR